MKLNNLEEAIQYYQDKAEENIDMCLSGLCCNHNQYEECKEIGLNSKKVADWLLRLQDLEHQLANGNLRGCINCKYRYVDTGDTPCVLCEECSCWEIKLRR